MVRILPYSLLSPSWLPHWSGGGQCGDSLRRWHYRHFYVNYFIFARFVFLDHSIVSVCVAGICLCD